MAGNFIINNANGNTVTLQNPDTNTEDLVIDLSSVGDGSVPTPYHIYNGSVEATNTVVTNGFSTTLYTGNGSTQSVNTGVDMSTQWGNDASETFGGLVWLKGRSGATGHRIFDTVRGVGARLTSNGTDAEAIGQTAEQSAFNNNGFSIGSDADTNTNLATYASWNFQTTHRRTGTTNHGKAYTEHYNPYTGFTIIKYEGSGIAGHEIPHSLGRNLGISFIKNLTTAETTYAWECSFDGMPIGNALYLNNTVAMGASSVYHTNSDVNVLINTSGAGNNTSTNQYIMYGWANSYYDEDNTLIGNYEVGVYQGTGAAGNKVTTRGKPAWVMIKRLDSTGNWILFDNIRVSSSNDGYLYANGSNAETINVDAISMVTYGFTINNTFIDTNASGGQYLYMVVYDNDNESGKSKYPKATDTTNLTIDALVPYANGIDTKGSKVSIIYKNETISGLTLTQGKNYIFSKNDGTYGSNKYEPMYGSLRNRVVAGENPDYFDLKTMKWYGTSGGTAIYNNAGDNITGWYKYPGGSTTLTTNGSVLTTTWDNTTTLYTNYLLTGLTVGKTYIAEVDISSTTGEGHIIIGDATLYGTTNLHDASSSAIGNSITSGSSGKSKVQFTANATSVALGLRSNYNGGSANIKWDNISVFELVPTIGSEITPRTYLDCIVYADHNGQVSYVEELPKTTYFDEVKANDYRGKNACTAWVLFDNTTTPPTILDSYNVSSVIKKGAGISDIYFEQEMDTNNYIGIGSTNRDSYAIGTGDVIAIVDNNFNTTKKATYVSTYTDATTNSVSINYKYNKVIFFGGKN